MELKEEANGLSIIVHYLLCSDPNHSIILLHTYNTQVILYYLALIYICYEPLFYLHTLVLSLPILLYLVIRCS